MGLEKGFEGKYMVRGGLGTFDQDGPGAKHIALASVGGGFYIAEVFVIDVSMAFGSGHEEAYQFEDELKAIGGEFALSFGGNW